jgi:hypothetical protein
MEKIMMSQQQQSSAANMQNQQQDYRRDSGSSTQHSGNSYYAYQQNQFRYDCIECRAKMRENETMFNFPVEVPEAFQDSYQESNDTLRNTFCNTISITNIFVAGCAIALIAKNGAEPIEPATGHIQETKVLAI